MRGGLARLGLFGALALFVLLPLAQTFLISFINTLPRDGMAEGAFTLQNYRTIWETPELTASIGNSLVYVVLNVVLCIAVALPAAYALARYQFAGDRHFLFLLLAFRATPPVVLSLPILRANPKSTTCGVPASSSRMLPGFRSR